MAKIDPVPQKYMSKGVALQNLSKKWKRKKVRGVLFSAFSKDDDVIR